MASILGDPLEAEPIDYLPPPMRFPARLAELENLRGSISNYLTTLDYAQAPAQPTAVRSFLEDDDLCPALQADSTPVEITLLSSPATPPPQVPAFRLPIRGRKPKRKKQKTLAVRPAAPRRDFIKENILNLRTTRKSPGPLGAIGEEWRNQLLHPRKVSPPPVVLKGILKPEEKKSQETAELLRKRIESAKVVRNEGLLAALFDKVADSLALHWEEAADLIVDELLEEEALRLCAAEEQRETVELNVQSMLSLVQDYDRAAASLRTKYCVPDN